MSVAEARVRPQHEDPPTQAPRAGWRRGVPVVLGLVLLVAGGLKAYQLATGPVAGDALLGSRWAVVVPFELELLLGLWLLAGVFPRQSRLTALASFGAFLGVSGYQALAGEPSCGCFGALAVSPWMTAGFDLAAVAALWWWLPVGEGGAVAGAGRAWLGGLAATGLLAMGLTGLAAAR